MKQKQQDTEQTDVLDPIDGYTLDGKTYRFYLDDSVYDSRHRFLDKDISPDLKAFKLLLSGKALSVEYLAEALFPDWKPKGKDDPRNGRQGAASCAVRNLRKIHNGCYLIKYNRTKKRYRLELYEDGTPKFMRWKRKAYHRKDFYDLKKKSSEQLAFKILKERGVV